jgi:hypothetical protein
MMTNPAGIRIFSRSVMISVMLAGGVIVLKACTTKEPPPAWYYNYSRVVPQEHASHAGRLLR